MGYLWTYAGMLASASGEQAAQEEEEMKKKIKYVFDQICLLLNLINVVPGKKWLALFVQPIYLLIEHNQVFEQ